MFSHLEGNALHAISRSLILLMSLNLSACDLLGIDSPEKVAAQQEAEGKAIGRACRHGGRAIEDCYNLNPDTSKAAIFDGWRDMDEYLRENKLEAIPPTVPHQNTTPEKKTESPKKTKKGEDTAEENKKEEPKTPAENNTKKEDPKKETASDKTKEHTDAKAH
jgi:outer membrane biosynthesis protein TonB